MDKIESQALASNLAQTQVKQIILSPDSLWLLERSASYYGIQQRTKLFLEELHHPFANLDSALELMRQSIVGDLWFYLQLEESEHALELILAIFGNIFDRAEEVRVKQLCLNEYLDFVAALAEQEKVTQTILDKALDLLEDWHARAPELFLAVSGQCFKTLLKLSERLGRQDEAVALLRGIYEASVKLWRDKSSIADWHDKYADLLTLRKTELEQAIGKKFFAACLRQIKAAKTLRDFADIPSHSDIASRHRDLLASFSRLPEKIHYLFYLLSLPTMNALSDHLLWDLNRLLGDLHESLSAKEINLLIDSIFDNLAEFRDQHGSIVLDCVRTVGKAVLDPAEPELARRCLRKTIDLGFIPPGEIKINRDWQIVADKNHIKNIRVWLELISIDPVLCKDLLAALIINLTQGGIFISDTDLFQKDVSQFLNSDIKPLFVQVKQLLRLFPVFYHEIGAEGEIRDLSTDIDEMSSRKDRLIHFVRKQVHTESNNTHINLLRQILNYWTDLDPGHLKGLLPDDVALFVQTPDERTKAQHKAVKKFFRENKTGVDQLLGQSWQTVAPLFRQVKKEDFSLRRLELLTRIYYMLLDKYQLDPYDIAKFLARFNWFDEKEQLRLRQSLARKDFDGSIRQMLAYIARLNHVILDPKPTQSWENIYYKRHIAAGIPSMYGQYREPKLEAMGMIFRLESLVERLVERNIKQLNLDYISGKTLKRIIRILELFEIGLAREGLTSEAFSSALEMLKSGQRIVNLSLDQYLDLFKQIKDSITELINEYYYRFYEQELENAPVKGVSGKYKRQTARQMFAEDFFRKLLASSFLVQHMDSFIAQILASLDAMKRVFGSAELSRVMSYDPDLMFIPLHTSNGKLDNQVLLGSKAFFLKKMCRYDFPIPPGFVITTELHRYGNIVRSHPGIEREMDELLRYNITRLESQTGLRYGDPEAPLLFSVRSGAPMSLPGAMATFLNIGLNDEITLKLSTHPNYGWTAWDCYRRLIQSWGMAYGIDRDEFDAVMISFKRRHKVKLKTQFTPLQMRQMSESYKKVLARHKLELEQDVFLQVKQAIMHVLDSWNTDRARLYRQKLQIADDWGTAVTIQKMVLGNICLDSGTGVLFTHAPWNKAPGITLNGDFTLCSQGEDVVAGLVHTLPISEQERKQSKQKVELSLEKDFPQIYDRLFSLASHLLDERGYPHQEIEFTFESPARDQLYILQTRNQVITKARAYTVFNVPKRELKLLGNGIGIGKGVINGLIAISRADIDALKDRGQPLILVRPDTVPEDMELLFDCQGLLTSRGGVTSHAAVTAIRLGLVGIVNCRQLKVFEDQNNCRIGETLFKPGDEIAIDAGSGAIYLGHYPVETISR
ncbi:MAG: PEP/pyruvate-binding domain-containing protein [Candidatus Cloacimonetes bacterium]|nr:PEP/pyruvate-binding domain-containing protein [Candidatus Cloacimonadota bacterium]